MTRQPAATATVALGADATGRDAGTDPTSAATMGLGRSRPGARLVGGGAIAAAVETATPNAASRPITTAQITAPITVKRRVGITRAGERACTTFGSSSSCPAFADVGGFREHSQP